MTVLGEDPRHHFAEGNRERAEIMAFIRLRTNAQTVLGDTFNYRRFNDAVVLGGAVPMSVLERVIDGYIERERR